MSDALRRGLKTIGAALVGGVAVGPPVAFGLRAIFLLQGSEFRWVLILCTLVAAATMGAHVWRDESRRVDRPPNCC